MTEFNCARCGRRFPQRGGRGRHRRFCSLRCQAAAKANRQRRLVGLGRAVEAAIREAS